MTHCLWAAAQRDRGGFPRATAALRGAMGEMAQVARPRPPLLSPRPAPPPFGGASVFQEVGLGGPESKGVVPARLQGQPHRGWGLPGSGGLESDDLSIRAPRSDSAGTWAWGSVPGLPRAAQPLCPAKLLSNILTVPHACPRSPWASWPSGQWAVAISVRSLEPLTGLSWVFLSPSPYVGLCFPGDPCGAHLGELGAWCPLWTSVFPPVTWGHQSVCIGWPGLRPRGSPGSGPSGGRNGPRLGLFCDPRLEVPPSGHPATPP